VIVTALETIRPIVARDHSEGMGKYFAATICICYTVKTVYNYLMRDAEEKKIQAAHRRQLELRAAAEIEKQLPHRRRNEFEKKIPSQDVRREAQDHVRKTNDPRVSRRIQQKLNTRSTNHGIRRPFFKVTRRQEKFSRDVKFSRIFVVFPLY